MGALCSRPPSATVPQTDEARPAYAQLDDHGLAEPRPPSSPARDSLKEEPQMQRSSLLELALAQCALLVSVVLLVFFTSGWLRLAIAALWLFQIARLHLQVWRFGGWASFMFLCRRLPHAYVWTLATFPPFLALKSGQWLLSQLFLDNSGRVHRCEGRELTILRWWRLSADLQKPLRPPSSRIGVMPNVLAPTLACLVYSAGPWASLDVLRLVCSEESCSMRNDLFGTHFSYNYHISGFVENGHLYFNVADATVLWPLTWLASSLWASFAATLPSAAAEAEARTSVWPTVTYTGLQFWSDKDPPSLDSLWYPHLRDLAERRPTSDYVLDGKM